ncbi:hypothetical protein GCM10023189_60350 [Nibrella saemangeumensis]|uniref:Aerotolerance regulator N-terminal domain-containing protein n=1 Tax=Nibrella saemangeumensis TaxID=1084526 RepID=A0ABP8NPV7_9BACT
MEFLEPLLLWGGLAVVIPVGIHFWHQKRGKVIGWAATQWLTEKNQQQHRGLRLENLPLLILRCLLVLLLALLLSQPMLTWLNAKPAGQKIHLVLPNPFLVDNFRFELDDALRKGEKVYWIVPTTEPTTALTQLPAQQPANPLLVQASINQLREQGTLKQNDTLYLYLVNNAQYRDIPYIHVPAHFLVHAVIDSGSRPVQRYLVASDNGNVFVNAAGQLTNSPTMPSRLRFSTQPVHTGPIAVLLDYRNKAEQQTVAAALQALADVYKIDLTINLNRIPDKPYQWVLTDRLITTPVPQTLYVVSGGNQAPILPTPNIRYIDETLTPQTTELVANGQLPEWLGELLVTQFGLQPATTPLSRVQWNDLFIRSDSSLKGSETTEANTTEQSYLVLLFVMVLGIERWLALRTNA